MKQGIGWKIISALGVLGCVAFFLGGHGFSAEESLPAQNPGGPRVPVVVELFTSEGCSSCPPADRLLVQLDREQPVPGAEVIALGWHVDYWDQLGWRDAFSSSDYTARQQDYSRAFGTNGVYTPQMVVDGRTEFVGSDTELARRSITRAAQQPKAAVQILLAPGSTAQPGRVSLSIRVAGLSAAGISGEADVLLAVTENDLGSNVTRGENAGRRLDHRGVVRWFGRVAQVAPGLPESASFDADVSLRPEWKRENLRVVAFVQERKSRRILGAAAAPLLPL